MQLYKSTEFSFVIKEPWGKSEKGGGNKNFNFPAFFSFYTLTYFTFNIPDDEHVFPSFPSFHVEEGGQTLKE